MLLIPAAYPFHAEHIVRGPSSHDYVIDTENRHCKFHNDSSNKSKINLYQRLTSVIY